MIELRAIAVTIASALVGLAGCPSPSPAPSAPQGSAAAPADPAPSAPIDAPEPSQQEKLAAIQKAMNELDEAAQGCWAAAAVERFDIEGDITATIDIAPGGAGAKVALARDTTGNAKLSGCLTKLLERYPWAPPLYGQAIQLPFQFRAPDGQNVIDRTLVPWVGQGRDPKLAIAVLLDENNSGNDAASIVEVALRAGGSTGMRTVARPELWYFLGPATVKTLTGQHAVAAGDMLYVPPSGTRDVSASSDIHAMIAMVPGGREGSARAGALPTRELAFPPKGVALKVLPAKAAKTYAGGKVRIYLEPSTIKGRASMSASVLSLPAGAVVPPHVHENETELLYVLAGSGTLTVAGVAQQVTPTSTIQIPPDTEHAFTATTAVRAVQIYTPPGPEQRFKKPPTKK